MKRNLRRAALTALCAAVGTLAIGCAHSGSSMSANSTDPNAAAKMGSGATMTTGDYAGNTGGMTPNSTASPSSSGTSSMTQNSVSSTVSADRVPPSSSSSGSSSSSNTDTSANEPPPRADLN